MLDQYFENASNDLIVGFEAGVDEYQRMDSTPHVIPEHLFAGIMSLRHGAHVIVLERMGILPERLYGRTVIAMGAPRRPVGSPIPFTNQIKISNEVRELFEVAEENRKRFDLDEIPTDVMLLGFFGPHSTPGIRAILVAEGVTEEMFLETMMELRESGLMDKLNSRLGQKETMLDKYTTDFTKLAREGKLDEAIGRDEEIVQVAEILQRRKKSNPMLIGEPGVGKTAIVEGLAIHMISPDAPEFFKGKKLLSLEIGTLMAGASMVGEFENRLTQIKKEILESGDKIILFIDEIHQLIGTGRTGNSGMDGAQILKPALANGQIRCIGATTYKEYKLHIETDKALERRFHQIQVQEPTVEQAIEIIRGSQAKYEQFHGLAFEPEAIESAVKLSAKYIQNRFLPDKAFDLIDISAATKKVRDFSGFVAPLSSRKANPESDKVITVDNIKTAVTTTTGIPVQRLANENTILMELESRLSNRVIGQSKAVAAVANAVRRNRAGLRKQNAPVATFLFLGSTGVGKTELVKALAEAIMGDDQKIIRLDMSEYMEAHTVSKLIGSPPGYVGFGRGGQLTEKVKHAPHSVVLLDEFEKAHPDVLNVLLQVLDEGWLTDGEGQKVSFQHTIIVATSNVGSVHLTPKKQVGFAEEDSPDVHKLIMKELERAMRPELINRFDDLVMFNKLTKENYGEVFELRIAELRKRLDAQGLKLEVDPGVIDFLVASIDTDKYGARPLARKIQQELENPIAMMLISGAKPANGVIRASVAGDKLSIFSGA